MGKLLQCRKPLLRAWVEMTNESKSDKLDKTTQRQDAPDHCECKRGIYVYEQAYHFVRIMKDKAVPPRDDGTRNGAMAKTVTCNEERGRLGEDP